MVSVPMADVTPYIMKSELHGDITEFQKGRTCSMHMGDQKQYKQFNLENLNQLGEPDIERTVKF
jgi:hypothetical protein